MTLSGNDKVQATVTGVDISAIQNNGKINTGKGSDLLKGITTNQQQEFPTSAAGVNNIQSFPIVVEDGWREEFGIDLGPGNDRIEGRVDGIGCGIYNVYNTIRLGEGDDSIKGEATSNTFNGIENISSKIDLGEGNNYIQGHCRGVGGQYGTINRGYGRGINNRSTFSSTSSKIIAGGGDDIMLGTTKAHDGKGIQNFGSTIALGHGNNALIGKSSGNQGKGISSISDSVIRLGRGDDQLKGVASGSEGIGLDLSGVTDLGNGANKIIGISTKSKGYGINHYDGGHETNHIKTGNGADVIKGMAKEKGG